MSNIITTIPKGRPDHISLDFDLLRAEGIQHLENLATEVWTDFNAHDPGITILELLSYAITDLGYRTRMLPIADLLAGNDPTKKTWFTATEVLAKHDENYMPPEAQHAVDQAQKTIQTLK